ncbi:hypothetical protein D3C75_638670 [compost metagenome]
MEDITAGGKVKAARIIRDSESIAQLGFHHGKFAPADLEHSSGLVDASHNRPVPSNGVRQISGACTNVQSGFAGFGSKQGNHQPDGVAVAGISRIALRQLGVEAFGLQIEAVMVGPTAAQLPLLAHIPRLVVEGRRQIHTLPGKAADQFLIHADLIVQIQPPGVQERALKLQQIKTFLLPAHPMGLQYIAQIGQGQAGLAEHKNGLQAEQVMPGKKPVAVAGVLGEGQQSFFLIKPDGSGADAQTEGSLRNVDGIHMNLL